MAGLVLAVLARGDLTEGDFIGSLGEPAAGAYYAALGMLIVRRAANRIGWLMLGAGAMIAADAVVGVYGVIGIRHPGTLPAATLAGLFAEWLFVPLFTVLIATFLLFPDGRLPSPRWWPAGLVFAAFAVLGMTGFLITPRLVHIPAPGGSLAFPNPLGVASLGPVWSDLLLGTLTALTVLSLLLLAIVVAALVTRFRRGGSEVRHQVKWLAFAMAVFLVSMLLGPGRPHGHRAAGHGGPAGRGRRDARRPVRPPRGDRHLRPDPRPAAGAVERPIFVRRRIRGSGGGIGGATRTFGHVGLGSATDARGLVALIRRGIHFGSYGRVDDGTAVFGRLAEAARAAEESGFDAISVPDHVHQNRIGGGPASPMFEAYTVLGALAQVTASATLFALVSPVTMRAPGLLAKAVTTLDVISGGRAMLGVGAGWDVAEHEAYGIGFPGLGERFDRLDEELAICRAMFTQEQATFAGKFYTVRDAYNAPRPVRGPVPVLVAGGGEKRTLDLVARYGDACNVFAADPDSVRHKFDVLARHCDRVGRDPAEITRTVFAVGTSDLAALAASARSLADAGADGMIVVGPEDPAVIGPVGAVLAEAFPG